MNPKLETTLQQVVDALRAGLGDNLHSCCLYGSAVRGNAIEGVSDLNVLIVLNESDAAAHRVIAEVIAQHPLVDPFVLARRGLERSVRAFAPKFASIRRHYRVLHGADPLAEARFDPKLERFLCEQVTRNLRLRLVFSFVTRSRHKAYGRFLVAHTTPLFVQFAEILRLEGIEVPKDFAARIPVFERHFEIDGGVLRDLLALKQAPRRLDEKEAVAWHERVFPVVDRVLRWVEARWTA